MRSVVITGGSAGIGRAVAEIYACRGCRIGLIARGEERLQDAALALQSLGSPGVAAAADVSEAAEVEAAADRFEHELGPIDVWINAVMMIAPQPTTRSRAGRTSPEAAPTTCSRRCRAIGQRTAVSAIARAGGASW
jgi:NAD(P)-dependent dehydrogenase (short-subunit alcohol dehydrogenase family)